MKCDDCAVEYDNGEKQCIPCKYNPLQRNVDNFQPTYIDLNDKEFELSTIQLDPLADWKWTLIEHPEYNRDVYHIIIDASGIMIKRVVTICEGRWHQEKIIIVAERYNLPLKKYSS